MSINAIQNAGHLRAAFEAAQGRTGGTVSSADVTEREAFQAAVAGTFFKMMLKSMHKMHDKPAYFHGGQAEEAFQNQMNELLAEDFAKTNGAPLVESLYKASVQNRGGSFSATA
jgi:hypothetical protein